MIFALVVLAAACSSGGSDPGISEDGGVPIEDGGGEPVELPPLAIAITAPELGLITSDDTVTISGTTQNAENGVVHINGVVIDVDPDGAWTTTVDLRADPVLNSIIAELERAEDGAIARDRIVVLAGESIADGDFSPESVALRINDTALDEIEPLVGALVGGDLDLADLVPVGTKLIDKECFLDSFLGCLGKATVKIDTPAPSFTDFMIDLDSRTDRVLADIDVQNIRVNVKLKGSGLIPDCDIEMSANRAEFSGVYLLEPDPVEPSFVDVNLDGSLSVQFNGFDLDFGGICDAPIIGDIIQAFLPDVEDLATDAIAAFLRDPDGSGPQDDPISDAAEDALAGISIAGPIGEALMVSLDAPMFVIVEDTAGLTIGSDGRMVLSEPAPGAPDLAASYHIPTEFPVFGPTTPGGQLYGLGICVSPSFFNQLFKTTAEAGLIADEVTELNGVPLTAGTLGALLQAYSALPVDQALKIVIRSDVAPFMTGANGPAGELGELVIPHLVIEVQNADDGMVHNRIAIDISVGLDITVDADTGELAPTLTMPGPGGIQTFVLQNAIGADESLITNVLAPLIGAALPEIGGALESFPLPEFFGLRVEVVETAREGAFYSIYANLAAAD